MFLKKSILAITAATALYSAHSAASDHQEIALAPQANGPLFMICSYGFVRKGELAVHREGADRFSFSLRSPRYPYTLAGFVSGTLTLALPFDDGGAPEARFEGEVTQFIEGEVGPVTYVGAPVSLVVSSLDHSGELTIAPNEPMQLTCTPGNI